MSESQNLLHWSDLVCYLCEPGHRPTFESAGDLMAHWQKKHHHHPHLRWQMAQLMDKMQGFSWRPHIPEVDAWSDGLCPTCGKTGGDAESTSFKTGKKAWNGGEETIIVIYCRRCGDIIRRVSN